MTRPGITDAQIAEWRCTSYPYKIIAAQIAEWALNQERGTILPGNEHFTGDTGTEASEQTWRRAKKFLARTGVIYTNDGLYRVS